jgi:hypothetical protein
MYSIAGNDVLDQINQCKKRWEETSDFPFSDRLPADLVTEVVGESEVKTRKRVFDRVVTVWAFLSQVLSQDHSCREVVARVLAWRVRNGQKACSAKTSSYCEARQRLPKEAPAALARRVGQDLEQQVVPEWRWKGRDVKVVDGSTVVLPDTKKNQAAFPQNVRQKRGLGFPIVRIVVLFSLATGAALEMALGPCYGKKTGENTLFRQMQEQWKPGDVVLGDRLFDSYRDIVTLQARGVDVVFRMNATRHHDFRRGRWLGREDHVVEWRKPKFDASRIDRATYDALPETKLMREIRFQVEEAGFRPKSVILVTTLLDPDAYPAEELASLYRQRWHAELDLNALKTTLQMERLRCKTPEMVYKELWMHFLAYNLIRTLMTQAARQHQQRPRNLSFKGALQTMTVFASPLATCPAEELGVLAAARLKAVASHPVGDRPNRYEPRVVKRRSKYSLMTVPRAKARQRLAA